MGENPLVVLEVMQCGSCVSQGDTRKSFPKMVRITDVGSLWEAALSHDFCGPSPLYVLLYLNVRGIWRLEILHMSLGDDIWVGLAYSYELFKYGSRG